MAIQYNKNVLGRIVITQKGHKFNLEIRQGNCLAVIIGIHKNENDETIHTLMQFFADEQHLKRTCKAVDNKEENAPIYYDVKNISLNMKYKESATLLKHLVKYYKINCYYK